MPSIKGILPGVGRGKFSFLFENVAAAFFGAAFRIIEVMPLASISTGNKDVAATVGKTTGCTTAASQALLVFLSSYRVTLKNVRQEP